MTQLVTQLQSKCIPSGSRYAKKCVQKFLGNKYNHVNNKKIQDFYCSIDSMYSDKLYEVKFKKSFSFYLYLYLKDCYEDFSGDMSYNTSLPVDVNFSLISEYAKVGRNTVKRAYKELIDLGLVISLVGNGKHNSIKKCQVVNDRKLVKFDEVNGVCVFNLKKGYKNAV